MAILVTLSLIVGLIFSIPLKAEETCPVDFEEGGKTRSCGPTVLPDAVPVKGLMLTKDDGPVLGEWLFEHMWMLDAIVILDGNAEPPKDSLPYINDFIKSCPSRSKDIHWVHEHQELVQNILPPNYTSDGILRHVALFMLRAREKTQETRTWVMLCHADEFMYNDPRLVAAAAQQDEGDHAFWYALHVLPYPGEEERLGAPLVQQRFHHFHHDWLGLGYPFMEGRLFRDGPGVEYNFDHGVLLPAEGLFHPWKGLGQDTWQEALGRRVLSGSPPLQAPAYLHYKMTNVDPSEYVEESFASTTDPGENISFWKRKGRWVNASYPVGVYHNVSQVDGFFIDSLPEYLNCSRFDGKLEQFAWSLPLEFRVERNWSLDS